MRMFTRLLVCGLLFSKAIAQAPSTKPAVSFGNGIAAFQQRSSDSAVVILSFSSKELAAQSRTMLSQRGILFAGPEFIELPIQGVKISGADIDWLTGNLPGIIGIYPNKKLSGDLNQAVIASRVSAARADATFVSLNGGLPITGRGVGVLVNDSGFDGDDTDIQGNDQGTVSRRIVQNVKGNGSGVAWSEDFAVDNGLILDSDQGGGHGSHCMGIVGGDGRKSGGKFTGVAPGSYLIGYGSGAGLSILDVDGGFEYVLRHGRDYNIKVMSNSYGSTSDTSFTSFDPANPTSIATKALADRGVTVVFSAGNSGPGAGTITGNFKTAPWVICVGNGLKTGPLASSSSRGRPQAVATDEEAQQATVNVGGVNYLWENRPTVTAPGTDIVSVRATAGPVGYTGATQDVTALTPAEIPYYAVLSGTSMACPHVAGIAALMLEANPKLEWRAIKAILQRTSVPMPEKKWQSGEGYVNAHAAVAAAYYGLCNTTSTDYNTKYGLPADGSFGFDSDTWKTCPIHPEVLARISSSMPSITGVQSECAADVPPLTDPTGVNDQNGGTTPPAPAAQFDIKEVRFTNETATSFDVVMELAGNLVAVAPGAVGVQLNYFDAHFVLDKVAATETATPEPQVGYIVSSYKTAAGNQFKLTVRSGDGTTRPVTNTTHYEDITGNWNTTTNTITWTVPKAKLNVNAIPASISTAGTRTGRAAKLGDRLRAWEAYTYERTGTLTPDGAGVYTDKASGSCFKTLSVQ